MLIRVTVVRYEQKDVKNIHRDLLHLGLAQNVSFPAEGIQGDFTEHNSEGCAIALKGVTLLQVTYDCKCKLEVR